MTTKRESEIKHGIYILFGSPVLVGLLIASSDSEAPANGLIHRQTGKFLAWKRST